MATDSVMARFQDRGQVRRFTALDPGLRGRSRAIRFKSGSHRWRPKPPCSPPPPAYRRRPTCIWISEADLRDRAAHRRFPGQRQACDSWSADHFKKTGGKVREQPFRAEHPLTGQRLVMVNLIGSWQPERSAAGRDRRPLRHPPAPGPGGQLPQPPESAIPGGQRPCLGRRAPHGNRQSPQRARDATGASTWSSSTAKSWSSAITRDDGRVFPRLEGVRTDLLRVRSSGKRTRCATRPGSCSTWLAAAT